MSQAILETHRQKLLDRKTELLALSDMSKDSRKAVELDQSAVGRVSRVDAMQSQAMALATERNRATELQRIKSALTRIDKGDFGWCITCGDEIAPKRLDFDPSLPTCITCAARK